MRCSQNRRCQIPLSFFFNLDADVVVIVGFRPSTQPTKLKFLSVVSGSLSVVFVRGSLVVASGFRFTN